jgi:hypothetical protein
MCAFFAPLAGELVLDMEGAVGAGNIVQGAETLATTFKNEIIKGIPWGLGEGAGFIAGSKVIENAKKDLGIDKLPPKKRKRTRKIG